ncbi:hypothetical protein D5086_018418 [Populus alba]|uniref:Uncharacterized protein n=1 Tax=Populus alba TaxID=43335 RepID=A0ACC4BPM9_POPAL
MKMSPPSEETSEFSLKSIPGDYGLPFFGAIRDRLDYFYNQGRDEFFSTRVQKYESTIFKTNMPPGPFIAKNPKVIAVLDAVSFPVLFDTSKVEKYNVLDVSQKKANFNKPSEAMSFDFVFRLFGDKDSSDTKLGSEGPAIVNKWLALQLAPLATLGLPKCFNYLEDIFLRTFPLPFIFVKSDYNKLYDAFYASSSSVLDKAESLGIKRDEACHNLVFLAGFNAFGGMKVWFPTLIKWVGKAGEKLHGQLAHEIRTVVKEEGGVTFQALDKMILTKSVVFEALRIEPPVPFQYGKARDNIVVHSHDAAFEIKKGEMIFGYQPFATKDPRIFDDPEEFVGHRFVGDGEKLLRYVYWSNGRETEDPTAENKQCPGKDLVLLLSRVLLVEFFLRYDTFTVETSSALGLGSTVTFTSLIKAKST